MGAGGGVTPTLPAVGLQGDRESPPSGLMAGDHRMVTGWGGVLLTVESLLHRRIYRLVGAGAWAEVEEEEWEEAGGEEGGGN